MVSTSCGPFIPVSALSPLTPSAITEGHDPWRTYEKQITPNYKRSLSCKFTSPSKKRKKGYLCQCWLTSLISNFGWWHGQSGKIQPFFFLLWHEVEKRMWKWCSNHGAHFNIFVCISSLHFSFNEKRVGDIWWKWSGVKTSVEAKWWDCILNWSPPVTTAHEAQGVLAKFLKASSHVCDNQRLHAGPHEWLWGQERRGPLYVLLYFIINKEHGTTGAVFPVFFMRKNKEDILWSAYT